MENKNLDNTKRTDKTDKRVDVNPNKKNDKVEFATDYDGDTRRPVK